MLHTLLHVVAYKITKVKIVGYVASSLQVLWYGNMEWSKEENFSLEWKIIDSMEYIWKIHIPFHALASRPSSVMFMASSGWGIYSQTQFKSLQYV